MAHYLFNFAGQTISESATSHAHVAEIDAVQPATTVVPRSAALKPLAAFVVLSGLALLIYHPVVHYDFLTLDDPEYILDNEAIADGLTPTMFVRAFTETFYGNWQPLAIIVHAYDVALFGYEPGLHHLSSVAWHLLNSMLLYVLALRLLRSPIAALCVAILFLVHPQRVEAVVWISSRQHMVGGTFFLLCLIAYTHYTQSNRRAPYILALLMHACAILSKSLLVATPFVLLLLDLWPLGRLRGRSESIRAVVEKIPFFAVSLISGVALLIREWGQDTIHSAQEVTLNMRLDNTVSAYGRYVKFLFVPDDLSFHYPNTMGSTPDFELAATGTMLLIVTLAAVLSHRRWPEFTVAWFWFVVVLVPVSGIISFQYHFMADRYVYVPHMGVSLGLVALGSRLGARRNFAIAGLIVVLAFAAYFTRASIERVPIFRTDLRLLTESIELHPSNPLVLNFLGYEYAAQGFREEAVSMYQRSLEISTWDNLRADSNDTAGLTYGQIDAPALAHRYLAAALVLRPDDEMLALRVQQFDEAKEQRAAEIGRLEERQHASGGLEIDNSIRLARLYALDGRADEAISLYRKLSDSSSPASIEEGIVDALTFSGRVPEALTVARAAQARAPEDANTNYILIRALLRAAELGEARSRLESAYRQFPEHTGMQKLYGLLGNE